MPKGKGTYGSQKGRPRKDAGELARSEAGEALMYQKRGPKYKRYSDVTSKTVATIKEELIESKKRLDETIPGSPSRAVAMKEHKAIKARVRDQRKARQDLKQRDIKKGSGEDEPSATKAIMKLAEAEPEPEIIRKEERKSGFGDVSPAEWRKKKDVGSKEGEYKRRDKTAKHPEGKRAGDVGGDYKAYMKEEQRKLHRSPRR
jgi:hypothetical protein